MISIVRPLIALILTLLSWQASATTPRLTCKWHLDNAQAAALGIRAQVSEVARLIENLEGMRATPAPTLQGTKEGLEYLAIATPSAAIVERIVSGSDDLLNFEEDLALNDDSDDPAVRAALLNRLKNLVDTVPKYDLEPYKQLLAVLVATRAYVEKASAEGKPNAGHWKVFGAGMDAALPDLKDPAAYNALVDTSTVEVVKFRRAILVSLGRAIGFLKILTRVPPKLIDVMFEIPNSIAIDGALQDLDAAGFVSNPSDQPIPMLEGTYILTGQIDEERADLAHALGFQLWSGGGHVQPFAGRGSDFPDFAQ